MKVLSLLINLVPYHVARWSAVAALPGWQVDIVQLRGEDDFKVLEATHQEHPFAVHTLGIAGKTADPATLLRLCAEFVEKLTPDLVVISGYSFPVSLAMLTAANRRGIPVVVCSESNKADFARRWLTEQIKSRVVKLCAAGFAGGVPQKKYLCELGLPDDGVFMGYNSVDNGHFAEGAAKAKADEMAVRERLKLPAHYFVAVARFTEKKNLSGLITAYAAFLAAAKDKDTAPDLMILGDGPLRADLESQIRELGLQDRVHLPGLVGYDALPAYYGFARAFIHASSTEQWGLVVNEAMAAALPVLVSRRCGCAPDLVHEGRNGRTFDPASTQEMADAMSWVAGLDDSALRRAGEDGRQIVERWSPAAFARGLAAAGEYAKDRGARRINWLDSTLIGLLMKREERA